MKILKLLEELKQTKKQSQEYKEFGGYQPEGRNNKKGKIKKIFLLPVIIFLAVFLISNTFYTVDEAEQAVVTTFGKVSKVETAGPHFKLPYPIQRVQKLEVNKTQKLQIGYSTGDGSEDLDNLEVVSGDSKMITGDFNIVNIDFFIEWKISDPVKFLFHSDSPTSILKMLAQSSARGIIGSKDVDGVLTTEKSIIQAEIKEKIIQKLGSYDLGIQILDVKIQDSEPPTQEVNNAFKEVETAKQEKETRINEALAYKNTKLPEAQSNSDKLVRDAEAFKESKINEARGEVASFNSMYAEYAKNKDITRTRMYLETIEQVLPGVTVYIDSGSSSISKMLPLKEFSNINIQGSSNGGGN